LRTVGDLTWTAAGAKLLRVYRETIASHSRRYPQLPVHYPISEARNTVMV